MPTTQITIGENRIYVRTIDMGWEEYKVGVEYDGDLHRTERKQYAKDVLDKRTLARLGWDESRRKLSRSARRSAA